MDINTPSLSKRWFGYRTECGLLASFALLIHYSSRPTGGMSAFIYETGDLIEGDAVDVLSQISKVVNSEYQKKLGTTPPPNDRGFFTQTWQGETRSSADGELFYVEPWKRDNYVPPWKLAN